MRFLLSGKKHSMTDEEIILRYRQDGDLRWIDLLFDRYSHLAFAVAFNYLKEEDESKDAVLEIFQKLGNDLTKYEIRKFDSWLHRVVRNKCLRLISKKLTKESLPDNLPVEEETQDVVFEKYLDQLPDAIMQLNEEQRTCIEKFYLERKSYKEVSEETNFDLNKVKSYIQNGKRNLKLILEKLINE